MTPEETVRRNEAIANFMGYDRRGSSESDYIWHDPAGWFRIEINFHERWEILMPVVEKIIKTWDKNAQIGRHNDHPYNFPATLHYAFWAVENQGKPMTEAVWMAVSDWVLSRETPEKQPEEEPRKAPKLVALVKFNDGVALVLDAMPQLKYKKVGKALIGQDGVFYDFLGYDAPSGRFKAFGGRQFDLPMEDGTVTHCNGQWWHGSNGDTYKHFGFPDYKGFADMFCSPPIATVEGLVKSSLFCSSYMLRSAFDEMVAGYEGPIYDRQEYEQMMREKPEIAGNE